MAFGWADGVGVAAAVLIAGVGVFVLLAHPRGWVNRLFFLLALMDGASTLLVRLVPVVADEAARSLVVGLYWWYQIAFLGLLGTFGIVFPRPPVRRSVTLFLGASLGVGIALLLGAYAAEHDLFWVVSAGGIEVRPLGNVVNAAFVTLTAALVGRLTFVIQRVASPSHRQQAALVLGGMALAYVPFGAVMLIQALSRGVEGVLVGARYDRLLAYWAFVAQALVVLVSAVVLLRIRAPERRSHAHIVLACYGGVALLALLAAIFRDVSVAYMLRAVALLAYPLLLGYSIARFEVFDIDRQMRRAATVTLATTGLGLLFLIAENAISMILEDKVLAGIPSAFLSNSIAAVVSGIGFIPIARRSRKVAAKIVPELSRDELRDRKLEIYRHTLAGALADGIIREQESRTLTALRSSLGISQSEHDRMLAEFSV